MLDADKARKMSLSNDPVVRDILESIECQIRNAAVHSSARFINYFSMDWRKDHQAYNDVVHELESNGYSVEYVPSFDDRDPADKPYLTIRW